MSGQAADTGRRLVPIFSLQPAFQPRVLIIVGISRGAFAVVFNNGKYNCRVIGIAAITNRYDQFRTQTSPNKTRKLS